MTVKTINLPYAGTSGQSSKQIQQGIHQCLSLHAEACSEAASIWARLHYGHAAYVDGSLNVKSIDFASDDSGMATMTFDWTFQDGCSDTFREGTGYVEIKFEVSKSELQLTWAWPEQPSTADEF